MNRGDRREEIFRDDKDRERFLETLGEVCAKTGWQVQARCLMGNHFHLVVETPQGNLVAGMKWFLGTDTSRFNRRHKLFGHLFSGRYKVLLVDGSGNGYLKTVCDYVHLNPVRAKLLKPEQELRAYRWSSWPEYVKAPDKRWSWRRVERLLGEYRIPKDSAAGRRELERAVEKRRETAEATAERIIAAELKRRKWDEAELAKRAKGDLGKVAVAGRLRAETLMSVAWITKRLQMGTAGYLNNRLYRWRKGLLRK
jgi:REP element-mobilizing transposase RayT